MWDTIQKLEYREKANIAEAKLELQERLSDRVELPLPGIHGEKLFLTGASKLRKRSAELNTLYENQSLPRGVKDVILLDAPGKAHGLPLPRFARALTIPTEPKMMSW